MTLLLERIDSLPLGGKISLTGSKSLSNRALIIQALCEQPFSIYNLSDSEDTASMQAALGNSSTLHDTGAAGTTMRFLTAYLSLQDGEQILTGSERMKQRPIGPLVESLRKIGADIDYMEKDNFPPLRIGAPDKARQNGHSLEIPANTSSQFISALLMIGPKLPYGLELHLKGEIVSKPYVEMTLRLMRYFGVGSQWQDERIYIPPQAYQPRDIIIESDWTSASYFYGLVALSNEGEIELEGLLEDSFQGDAGIAGMMECFGVKTVFTGKGAIIRKEKPVESSSFECNFLACPDLAQTLAVVCSGLGVRGIFSGLNTLPHKETNRINALQAELNKVGTSFQRLNDATYELKGKASFHSAPVFDTYDDHRMAMAFATLAALHPVKIHHPEVVRKSFPSFWSQLEGLGFKTGFE